MESFNLNQLDIFEIYRRSFDIKSEKACFFAEEGDCLDDESDMAKFTREALTLQSKYVESRASILNVLTRMVSYLNLSIDFSEFACFYDFIFFICGKKGHINTSLRELSVLRKLSGLKRKFRYDCVMVGEEHSDMHIQDFLELNWSPCTKRSVYSALSSVCDGDRFPSNPSDDGMDVTKHNSPLGSRSPCAVEGCFSGVVGNVCRSSPSAN